MEEHQHTQPRSKFSSFISGLASLVGKGIVAIVVLVLISGIGQYLFGEHKSSSSSVLPAIYNDGSDDYDSYSSKTLTEDEAIESYWDEIKEYATGTETIEACYQGNGNCYDLDADIYDGTITTLYFNNGGNLDFSADIDESGNAYDTDERGNDWEFTLDMGSSTVSDAVSEWAAANDYEIE